LDHLGPYVDRWNGQQFSCAPAQIATRALRAAVREFDVDHDVWAVRDEFSKRGIIAGDLKSAIRRGRCFADEIAGVFIALVRTHAKAPERFAGPPLSYASDNGVNVHDVVLSTSRRKNAGVTLQLLSLHLAGAAGYGTAILTLGLSRVTAHLR
jgi:hypothetical protein